MTILKEAGTVTRQSTGRFKIGVITPGTGSSGTYPRETIEAAGRDKVFPAGTHMYLDHQTEAQEFQRPEGSLRDLVGVLAEDAYWDEESGGLVAEARIYSNWRPVLEEMKDDIGVSIRAAGEVKEDAGQRVVTRLTEARSVDFVTQAGRGGKILEIIESARVREATTQETRELLRDALKSQHGGENTYVWVRDFDTDSHVVWFDVENADEPTTTYEQAYTINGVEVSLEGESTEVVPTTKYVPKKTNPAPAGKDTQKKEEAAVAYTPGDDTSRVNEADSPQVAALKKQIEELKAELAAAKKAKAKEARTAAVTTLVDEAFKDVEAPATKKWLVEKFSSDESMEDDAILAEAQAIAGESRGTAVGEVHGMGESAPVGSKESAGEAAPQHTDEDVINVLEGKR